MSCSHLDCNYQVYENEKCIFHCEKNNWINEDYVVDDYVEKWDLYKIEYFWQEFYNLSSYELNNFIFPYFNNLKYNDLDTNIDEITFNECRFLDDIKINNLVKKNIIFEKCNFNSSYISIENNLDNFVLETIIIQNNNCTIEIKNSSIQECKILDFQNKNTSLIFNNCSLDKFKFIKASMKDFNFYNVNLNDNSTLLIEDILVNKYFLEKLSQKADYLQFNSIKVLNALKFYKVEFNNTYFNDFNIENITSKVKIEKTSFLGAKFNAFEWGNISIINASRDTFRQLKYVLDEQNNYIQANNFFIMEMKKYKEELKHKPSVYWQDKFVFYLNEKISDFGRSWFLSILWFILISLASITFIKFYEFINIHHTILFYFLMPLFLIIFFTKNKLNFSLWFILIFYLFHSYMLGYNPFNEFANFLNLKIHKDYQSYSFIWFMHKLFTSFIIYHFIIALRRQTKR